VAAKKIYQKYKRFWGYLYSAELVFFSLVLSNVWSSQALGFDITKIEKAVNIALQADDPNGGRRLYKGVSVQVNVPSVIQTEDMITSSENYFDPKLRELTKALG
jgi:hypothetical protein